MNFISELFGFVLTASRDAAVLALLVWIVLLLSRQRLPPAWRHAMWMLVAIRLLLPVLPGSVFSWQQWLSSPQGSVAALQEVTLTDQWAMPEFASSSELPVSEDNARTSDSTRREEKGTSLMQIVSLLWGTGVLIFLGFVALASHRFRRKVSRLKVPDRDRQEALERLLASLCRDIGTRRVPRVLVTDAVGAPALTGIWQPAILLPSTTMPGLSGEQMRFVLLHELGHLRRGDVAVNWLLCFLQAFHWFNPVLWWAFHRTRIEAERSTDEWVLKRKPNHRPADYGETLLRLLEMKSPGRVSLPGVVGVLESGRDLRSRIEAICRYRGKRSRWILAGAVLLVTAVAVVGLTRAPDKTASVNPTSKLRMGKTEVVNRPAASGIKVGKVFDGGQTPQVHLKAKVWRLEEGKPDTLIAEPDAVVLSGEWAVFEDTSEFSYAVAYDPPSLPEALVPGAKGGGTLNEEEGKTPRWKTNPTDVVIPPFPAEIESRSVGWVLRARPRADPEGNPKVECVLDQTLLLGFKNEGVPVTVEASRGLFGRKKTTTLEENRQLYPIFLKRNRSLIVASPGTFESEPESTPVPPSSPEENDFDEFAKGIAEPGRPRLRVEISGSLIARELSKEKVPDSGAGKIYVAAKLIELDRPLEYRFGLSETPRLLNDPQFQVFIRALSQLKGVDLLAAPSVTLRSGEPGKIEITREFVHPARYDPPALVPESGFPVSPATPTEFKTRPLGVELGIGARLLSDGLIELNLSTVLTEFRQFLSFGGPIHEAKEGKPGVLLSENRIDFPVFDRRAMNTTVRIPNGHTVLLGGLSKEHRVDIEERTFGFMTEKRTEVSHRYVYVFVTAMKLDPLTPGD